jgi:hypothetical protein
MPSKFIFKCSTLAQSARMSRENEEVHHSLCFALRTSNIHKEGALALEGRSRQDFIAKDA